MIINPFVKDRNNFLQGYMNRIFFSQQGCFMETTKNRQKTRFSFFKICFSVLKFIFKVILYVIAMMLTPKKEEDETTSDMIMGMAEQDIIHNSFPSSKKRH